MPRRTQRELQAARNVQGAELPDHRWYPPAADECEHPDPVKNYLPGGYVVIPREAFHEGNRVGYAIVLGKGPDEREVFSIDTTNHGSVHSHEGPHDTTDLVEIRPIHSQQDVENSYWDSLSRVYDHYSRLTSN